MQWTLSSNCNITVHDRMPSYKFLFFWNLYEEDKKKKAKVETKRAQLHNDRVNRANQIANNQALRAQAKARSDASKRRR